MIGIISAALVHHSVFHLTRTQAAEVGPQPLSACAELHFLLPELLFHAEECNLLWLRGMLPFH